MGRINLGTRPPRDRDEVLEIEAEDVGGTSMVASLLTTLASQHGNAYFWFVARARDPGPPRPAAVLTSATFPATRPSMDDPAAQGAWLAIQRERFDELHRQLVDQGWRPVGPGDPLVVGDLQARRHRPGHPARHRPMNRVSTRIAQLTRSAASRSQGVRMAGEEVSGWISPTR